MLIVCLNGSPQKKGNTARLLQEAMELAAVQPEVEVKLIHVGDALKNQKSPFCYQCSTPCRGKCSQNTPLGECFDLLRKSDGLLVGSPVYFGSVSGQLKAFWDKTRILRSEKALLNVVGGGATVGSSRFGGQEAVLMDIYHMMLVQGMTVVGDGITGEDCGHLGAAAQKPSADDGNALQRVRIVMERIVEVARLTRPSRRR